MGIFYERQLQLEPFDVNQKKIKNVISNRKREQVVSLLDYPSSYTEIIPKKRKKN